MVTANKIAHNEPVRSPASKSLFFQPKLSINQPNDVYEQEADHIADQVMRMTETTANQDVFFKPAMSHVQRKSHQKEEEEKKIEPKEPASETLTDTFINKDAFFKPAINHLQRKCHGCEEEEEKKLHRKENSETEAHDNNGLDKYVSTLGSSGQQLPDASRQFFEPRFGHDFSNVKIHTDAVAANSARSINALAYTTGSNIVFNSGQYSPDTDSGKRLLGHELTHVIQQGNGIATKIQRIGDPSPTTPPVTGPASPAPTAPVPAASNCPVATCKLPIVLFSNTANCGTGDDFLNGDMPAGPVDPAKRKIVSTFYSTLSDADLLTKMKTGKDGVATLGGAPGNDAADHFFTAARTPVNHDISTPIGKAASNSDVFKKASSFVEAAFHTIITGMASKPASNNCAALSLTSSPVEKVDFPLPLNPLSKSFSDNLMLKAVIGGTHGIEVTLTALSVDCTAHTYQATIHFRLCDNFGVDEQNDLYSDSLYAFWVLQHMRTGHIAFVNNILLDTIIKKSF